MESGVRAMNFHNNTETMELESEKLFQKIKEEKKNQQEKKRKNKKEKSRK